jgi:hypothetical protein
VRLFGPTVVAYSLTMVRRLRNWTYRDVINFLEEHDFVFLKELPGSHERWIKRIEGAADKVVEVNFTHRSYPLGTIKTMVRQSGIDQAEWIKWAGS